MITHLECCIIYIRMSYLNITHPLNGIICIGLGTGLGIYLTNRFKSGWRLWWIGALTFVLSQVGHLPFNFLVLNPLLEKYIGILPQVWQLPLVAVTLGLSAGIFEEFTRYAICRWWAKDARTWSQGLIFGAGHGGLEAILIGAMSLYSFMQLSALRDIDLSTIIPANYLSLAQAQVSWYWSMPWYESLVGGVERLFVLPLHMAAALLVLQAINRRQFRWVWLAIGLHTLVNALAVYLYQTAGMYAAESSIAILAIVEIGIILVLRRSMTLIPVEPPVSPAPAWKPIKISEVPETLEKLEETRYQ